MPTSPGDLIELAFAHPAVPATNITGWCHAVYSAVAAASFVVLPGEGPAILGVGEVLLRVQEVARRRELGIDLSQREDLPDSGVELRSADVRCATDVPAVAAVSSLRVGDVSEDGLLVGCKPQRC